MSRGDVRKPVPPDVEDDVEILEVVGLDDDQNPVVERDPSPADEDGEEPDEYEIDVVFDDDEDDPKAAGRDAPAAGAREDAAEDDGSRERFLRLQAEFDNLKKRVEREKEDFFVHATSSLVERLLPVLDNFDRAVLHANEDPETGGGFLEGVRLIHKQLLDELTRQGLQPVDSVGTAFDPERHEAVATEVRSDEPSGTVLAEFQKGYFFRDRLLRPALVQVAVGEDDGDNGEGGDAADGEDAGGATEA